METCLKLKKNVCITEHPALNPTFLTYQITFVVYFTKHIYLSVSSLGLPRHPPQGWTSSLPCEMQIKNVLWQTSQKKLTIQDRLLQFLCISTILHITLNLTFHQLNQSHDIYLFDYIYQKMLQTTKLENFCLYSKILTILPAPTQTWS